MGEMGVETQTEVEVARLEQEVAALRVRLRESAAAARVGDAIATAVIAEEISAPASHQRLLEMIVETAASVISARAGALFLVDEAEGDLVFQVAYGGKAEEVKKIRVPLGHGIAGGVAQSGLPLAIAHAKDDPRWAKDIGERVEYIPESIVCVPLFYDDRVIGALELLDKDGAPSFSPDDIHTLSLFANQAAVTIEQSRTRLGTGALLASALGDEETAVGRELGEFGDVLDADPAFRSSLELARLVREIATQGEGELHAARELLRGFAEYLRSRPR
jgi:GAF domain-containing protein